MSARNDSPPPAPAQGRARREAAALGLVCLSALLQFAAFPPVNAGVLVLAAYVPWLLLAETRGARGNLAWGYVLGLLFFGAGVGWLVAVSAVLWVLVVLPLALFPAAFALLHHLVRSRLRLPLALSAPLLFTAVEFFRSFAATGFPWLYAGHAFHGSAPLLQTADLASSYGLSFLALAVNGLLADAFLHLRGRPAAPGRRLLCTEAAAAALLFLLAFVYGLARLGAPFEPGPRVFVVQGNVPQDIKLMSASASAIWDKHVALTLRSRDRGVDLVVWPETMVPSALMASPDRLDELFDIAADLDAHLLVGSSAYEPDPADPGRMLHYNSAYYLSPRGEVLGRYDKMHLVPGGEYVPFRTVFPVVVRVVRDALGYAPSVDPGAERDVFVLPARGGEVRFAAPVCYEIVFPDLVRRFASRGADFVVNVTNEGWFKESYEFEQMVAINKFRAVEGRVSVVRAANTGISNVIDPEGRVLASVEGPGGRRKAVEGVLCSDVPVDRRVSFYTRFGDVFGWLVLAAALAASALAALPGAWRRRLLRRPDAPAAGGPEAGAGACAGGKTG